MSGAFMEMMLWLSVKVANNASYSTDPKTNGLYAYFKFNEGNGHEFKDATGNEMAMATETTWKHDVSLNA